jgi:hypothetical protein
MEWFLNWILSTASSTALVGILAFLCKNLIVNRLKASVQHEFDSKLENLRTELRKNEEAFKADLRAKETQIEVLRSGALSGLVSRQAILNERRLKAIEQLWVSVEQLAPLKLASSIMAEFNFEKILELAAHTQGIRDLFTMMGKGFEPDKLQKSDAHKARPFVSELAWALFSAYQAIGHHAVVQVQMVKAGIRDPKLLNIEHVQKLAKAALPWYAEYIDQYGSAGHHNLLEPLETELLKELRRMMRGEESDKSSVEQAANIMKEVESVNEAVSKASAKNPGLQV